MILHRTLRVWLWEYGVAVLLALCFTQPFLHLFRPLWGSWPLLLVSGFGLAVGVSGAVLNWRYPRLSDLPEWRDWDSLTDAERKHAMWW